MKIEDRQQIDSLEGILAAVLHDKTSIYHNFHYLKCYIFALLI